MEMLEVPARSKGAPGLIELFDVSDHLKDLRDWRSLSSVVLGSHFILLLTRRTA